MRSVNAILVLIVAGIIWPGSNEHETAVFPELAQRRDSTNSQSAGATSVIYAPPYAAESAPQSVGSPPQPAESPPHRAESAPQPAQPAHIKLSAAIVAPGQSAPAVFDDHGYRFVRVRYDDNGGRRRRGAWATDYPTAERNLHEAVERTTGLHIDGPPIVLELTDERIFEHPFLYLTEPGYWRTNEEEVEMLRKYLDRGGFLLIDDFHDYGRGSVGPQWNNMYQNVKRVFPDREPVELTADHPIWSVYYDIDPDAAISTKNSERWGARFGPLDDVYYGIFDDDGRMVIAICYNQDIGDGWEWPNRNLADASTVSFQMAINMIIYALTH